jgi:predicted nucleotidyltransferase
VPANIKRLLSEFKKGLLKLYGERLKAIYLFGSYARGDYNDASDVDIMIVLDHYESYWEELVKTSYLASELSLEYGVLISRTIMTEKNWQDGDLPLLRNIRAEGIPA